LHLYATEPAPTVLGQKIVTIVKACEALMHEHPKVQAETPAEDFRGLLARVGAGFEQWLKNLAGTYPLIQEPILGNDGEIVAQPMFWFETLMGKYCCFGDAEPGQLIRNKLQDHGIELLSPGQDVL
jgi:hypothetical protein